jgi:hypothetical protein
VDPPYFLNWGHCSTEKSAEVQHKGHETVEGDEKHPAGKKQRRSGLGKNYGQGVGYCGYSVEQEQAKSLTGTGDHVKEGGGKG